VAISGTTKLRAPKYVTALTDCDSSNRICGFFHIGVFGHAVERSFLAEKNYRPPLPPEQSIFPDLAYHAPKGKTKNPATVATIASTKKGKAKSNKSAKANPRDSAKDIATDSTAASKPSATVTAVAATSNTLKCWNCETVGHRARECTEPRKIYCYRCGKREFTVKTCPTCARNADRSQ